MSALSEQRKRPSILNELWQTELELLYALPTFGIPLAPFTQPVATTYTLTTLTLDDSVSNARLPNYNLIKTFYVQNMS